MIAIIGDSYCADFYHRNLPGLKFKRQCWLRPDQASWVTDVVDHYDGDVEVYGFGGASWWHSWSNAVEDLKNRWHKIEAVVFCHTSLSRINNAWNNNLSQTINYPMGSDEEQLANQLFYKHIYDENFQKYAFEQHIKNLDQTFRDIKTIHFSNNFDKKHRNIMELASLSGTVFTTPLSEISIGGLKGSAKEIIHQIAKNDPVKLNNHFTDANNHAFSRLVIDSIENYSPGYKPIDFSKFGFNVINYDYTAFRDPKLWGPT